MSDKNRVQKVPAKQKLPDSVRIDAQRFVASRVKKYKHFDSFHKAKHLSYNQIDSWCQNVIDAYKKDKKYNMEWIYTIPAGRHNRLYKLMYNGKVPSDIQCVLLHTEELKDKYAAILEEKKENVKRNISINRSCELLYHHDVFEKKFRRSTIMINNSEFAEFSEVMSAEKKSVDCKVLDTEIAEIYGIEISIYEGINWNTITVRFGVK